MEDAQLSRLYWQCRRGMLELDILLRGFLDISANDLDEQGLGSFETLLAYPDQVILEYLMGRMQPVDKDVANVVKRIRAATPH